MAVAGREVLRWLSQGFVLQRERAEFEGLLLEIAEYAEEWITSAQSVRSRPAAARRRSAHPRGPRRRASLSRPPAARIPIPGGRRVSIAPPAGRSWPGRRRAAAAGPGRPRPRRVAALPDRLERPVAQGRPARLRPLARRALPRGGAPRRPGAPGPPPSDGAGAPAARPPPSDAPAVHALRRPARRAARGVALGPVRALDDGGPRVRARSRRRQGPAAGPAGRDRARARPRHRDGRHPALRREEEIGSPSLPDVLRRAVAPLRPRRRAHLRHAHAGPATPGVRRRPPGRAQRRARDRAEHRARCTPAASAVRSRTRSRSCAKCSPPCTTAIAGSRCPASTRRSGIRRSAARCRRTHARCWTRPGRLRGRGERGFDAYARTTERPALIVNGLRGGDAERPNATIPPAARADLVPARPRPASGCGRAPAAHAPGGASCPAA